MNYIKKQLVMGEQVRWAFRRHWWWLVRRLLGSLVATGIIVAVVVYVGIAGWLRFLPALPLLYSVLTTVSWWKKLLVITNQRIMLLGGIVNSLADKDDLSLTLIGNIDDQPHGTLGGLLGERDFNFQAGDPKSGIVANGFPEEALRAVRQAQGFVTPASAKPGQPGEGRTDALGRPY